MKKTTIQRLVPILVHAALAGTALHAGALKVDINRDGKDTDPNTEIGYVKWSQGIAGSTTASGTIPITRSFTTSAGESVTISFAQTAASQTAGGTGITFLYNASNVGGTLDLIGDGLTVSPNTFANGGQLTMTITGLNAGEHSLLTFHNGADGGWAANSVGPLDVHVNGTQVFDDLPQTVNATSNAAAASSFVTFTVAGPSDTTSILFASDPTAGSFAIRNPMINGFEIDTSNIFKTAQNPSPADGDFHVDGDAGTVTLSWSSALSGDTASHDVYFGTSEAAVATADHGSGLFLGNQTGNSIVVNVPDKHATYFWRIDEINTSAETTTGTVWSFRPRVLAFPGAEGHGRFARGGRGGKVVHVTSLADYGSSDTPIPGTLRYAIEVETEPRVVVFDISGMITLVRKLTMSDEHVTIAGQTAPGKGICIRQYALGLSGADDAIVRFLRNRPGNISGTTIDGGGLAGCDHSIMDHCSISWSIDEGFSGRGAKHITLQNTLISEALAIAGHSNYPPGTDHGYAATIGGDIASYHHNLLAHCSGRNWSLGGGLDAQNNFAGRLDIRNNVVYNWRSRTTDGGAMEVNFVNNYYKPGTATTFTPYAVTINHEDNFGGSQQCYFAGNIMLGHFDESNQTVGRRSVVDPGVPTPTYPTFVATPFFDHHVTTQTATGAYKRVLSDVGANRPIDDHDERVIEETRTGTHTYTGTGPYGGYPGLPNSQDDVGGWEDYPAESRPAGWDDDGDGLPNWWEELHGTDPASTAGDFSEANADPDNDGFTRLCDYLAWLALPRLEVAPGESVDLDLTKLTRGYTSSPVHAVTLAPESAAAGTLQLLGDGKTVRFTADAGFEGIASFTHTVTDSAGDSMSGGVAVRIYDEAVVPEPDPVPPIFLNFSTSQVGPGTTPATAGTISIAAPGSGWTYSAAAPVSGTTWNQILRPNPLIGSNSTSSTGRFVCNSANGIALADATGSPSGADLTVTLDIQDLDSNTTRTEPNTGAGGTPTGLMGQAWRIYRGGNSTIQTITGLPAGAHCHIYFYGSTTTAGQGCRFELAAGNVPAGGASFLETRGGDSGNLFANNGGILAPTTPAPAATVSTASDASTWGRLHAVVDSSGTLEFRSTKNSANGQYFNGWQIVPFAASAAYDDFCTSYGLDPETNGAPTVDHENDGLDNLVEFLVGGDPTVCDIATMAPVASAGAGGISFRYRRRTGVADFAADIVETSGDMAAWEPAIHGSDGVIIETEPATPGFVWVTVHLPAAPGNLFARLNVAASN